MYLSKYWELQNRYMSNYIIIFNQLQSASYNIMRELRTSLFSSCESGINNPYSSNHTLESIQIVVSVACKWANQYN